MPNYQRIQFVAWNLYTGPVLQFDAMQYGCGVDYRGLAGFAGYPRLDALHQCVDISARLEFTKRALQLAAAHADQDSGTLKVFLAPEFLFRGAAGAYFHDLIRGWKGKAPADLPRPFDQDWGGLFGGLQSLVADEKYKDWIFAFGTAVSTAGKYRLGDEYPIQVYAYNTALVQRGGADETQRKQTFVTTKHLKSTIDFLAFRQGIHHRVYVDSDVQYDSQPDWVLEERLALPGEYEQQRSALFCFPDVCRPNGAALIFGLEICLDHDRNIFHGDIKERTGRLGEAGHRVDIQLVPSCGMSLRPTSLSLLPEDGDRSYSYALNCDGLCALSNVEVCKNSGVWVRPLGGHIQLWNEIRQGEVYCHQEVEICDDPSTDEKCLPVDNTPVDMTAILDNPELEKKVAVDLHNICSEQLWNSLGYWIPYRGLLPYPGGAGWVRVMTAQPLGPAPELPQDETPKEKPGRGNKGTSTGQTRRQ